MLSDKDQFTIDENGFIVDPQQWTVEIAEDVAESLGVDRLVKTGLQVIEYLREHYLTHRSVLLEE